MDGICLGMVVNNEYVLYDIIPSSKLSFFFFEQLANTVVGPKQIPSTQGNMVQ